MNPETTPAKHSLVASFARGAALLAGSLLILDQITKAVVEKSVSSLPITVIPGFFDIVLVGNTGAAWGMFRGHRWPLLAVSAVFLLIIILQIKRITEGWPERYYAMGMIAAGIMGNSIDRIWRGAVVDFLDFHAFGLSWPAFNVADSAICVGVGIYIISSFKRPAPGHEEKSQ